MDFDRAKQYFLKILNNNTNLSSVHLRHIEENFYVIDYLMKNPGKHASDDVLEGVGVERFGPESQRISATLRQCSDAKIIDMTIENNRRYYNINEIFMSAISLLEKEDGVETISSAISRIRSEESVSDIEYNVDTIKNDKNSLIKYIQHIVNLETIIYSLEKRYSILEQERVKVIIKSAEDAKNAKEQITSKETSIKAELESIHQKKEMYLKDIKVSVEKPVAPVKPTFFLSPPESPYTRKPGLFNRKKVIAENELLRRQYEEELLNYNKSKNDFENAMSVYSAELEKYAEEKMECEEREIILTKEAQSKAFEEYDTRFPDELAQIKKLNEELKDIQINLDSKINDLIANSECSIKNKSIKYEQEYILHLLRDIIKAQIKLYSYGVIYGKYRSYVALSSFCDYLLAGRCTELEGPDGAYNLYELESRSDIVINKLDKILTSLDQIKENQYYIFNEIKTANDSLDMINGQLLVNNSLEVVEISKLNDIIANTNQTAYNTAVTAFYSKKNAELTDALGFMIAL